MEATINYLKVQNQKTNENCHSSHLMWLENLHPLLCISVRMAHGYIEHVTIIESFLSSFLYIVLRIAGVGVFAVFGVVYIINATYQ